MSKVQISENAKRSTVDRQRFYQLPVVNPSNRNEVINPLSVIQKRKMETLSPENDGKRRKLELGTKSRDADSAPINNECSLPITSLNDDVLLHTSRFLNWMDSINFVASSNRFLQLDYLWSDKRREEFILDEFMAVKNKLPKTMWRKIAPKIKVLRTGNHNMAMMKTCKSIESLRINYPLMRSATGDINSCIKGSNVRSLRFTTCDNIHALFHGVTDLEELEIHSFHHNTGQIIAKNANLRGLSIDLGTNYNFRVFRKLQGLQCLHIRSSNVADLSKIQEFGNVGELTEFSYECQVSDKQLVQSFIRHLADNSRLDKLQLVGCTVDADIFGLLNSLNLSALSLCCQMPHKDLTNFILANRSTRLKHLKLWGCFADQVAMMTEKWTSLETICFYVNSYADFRKIGFSGFIRKILATSRNRSALRLHMHTMAMQTEIYIDFVNQCFTKIEHNDGVACCSATKSFNFLTKECFPS